MGRDLLTSFWIPPLLLLLSAFSDVAYTGRSGGFGGIRGGGGWGRSGSFSRAGSPPMRSSGYHQPGGSNQGMKMAGAAAIGALAGAGIGYGMGSVGRPHGVGYGMDSYGRPYDSGYGMDSVGRPYRYRNSGHVHGGSDQVYHANRASNDTYDFALDDPYSAAPGRSSELQHITFFCVCVSGFGRLVLV